MLRLKPFNLNQGSYRPISLTAKVCKFFEKFIKDAFYKHLGKIISYLRGSATLTILRVATLRT